MSMPANVDRNVYIGKNVVVGDGARIMWGSWIGDNVEIGDGTIIYPHCVIGAPAEHKTAIVPPNAGVKIGSNCTIRESTTINSNTGDKKTEIGSNCYIMNRSYIAHDCVLDDNVVLCSGTALAGHVNVGSFTYFGLNSSVHQFSKIGKYCMIGAQAFFKGESPDAITWVGVPAKPVKINSRSLEKNVTDQEERDALSRRASEFIISRST
jgi:UDP-N-acetylglucosamine acyltransferase